MHIIRHNQGSSCQTWAISTPWCCYSAGSRTMEGNNRCFLWAEISFQSDRVCSIPPVSQKAPASPPVTVILHSFCNSAPPTNLCFWKMPSFQSCLQTSIPSLFSSLLQTSSSENTTTPLNSICPPKAYVLSSYPLVMMNSNSDRRSLP